MSISTWWILKILRVNCGKLNSAEKIRQAQIKFLQAKQSVKDTIEYLENPKRFPPIPEFWTKEGKVFNWNSELTIIGCAWTNNPSKFTSFVTQNLPPGDEKCDNTSHNANPSDIAYVLYTVIGTIKLTLPSRLNINMGELPNFLELK